MNLNLDGKTALVTGASRGIGFAIAAELAGAGAQVMLASRKQAKLDAALAWFDPGLRARVATHPVNVGDPDQVAELVAATMARFGACDILVNNAATNPYMGPLMGIDLPRYDKTWDVNLRGQLVAAQRVYEAWMREHGGVILNIASVGGLVVEPLLGAYNATKAALIHLTRTLAAELAPGVRVNAIAPGLVKTDMARSLWEANEAQIAQAMPLRRLGEPRDVANAALFLVSDAAAWITGTTLVVDGGGTLVAR